MTKNQQQKIEKILAEYVRNVETVRKEYRQKIENLLDEVDSIKLQQIKNKMYR